MSGHKWCDRNDGRCDSLALPDIDTALATGVLSLGNNHNYYNECCVILLGHLCVSVPPTSMGTHSYGELDTGATCYAQRSCGCAREGETGTEKSA